MSELHYLSLTDVARKVQSRELSSVEVTRHMIERIDRLDRKLRSYATVIADVALAQAKEADADIADGEFVAIVGPTGCGKSTLLNVAAGLIAPSNGTATILAGR